MRASPPSLNRFSPNPAFAVLSFPLPTSMHPSRTFYQYLSHSVCVSPRIFSSSTVRRILPRILPHPHLMSIDWRFVRAVRADDSAAAPSESVNSPFPLQEEWRGSSCDYVGVRWAEMKETTGRDDAGGIRGNVSQKLEPPYAFECVRARSKCFPKFENWKKQSCRLPFIHVQCHRSFVISL